MLHSHKAKQCNQQLLLSEQKIPDFHIPLGSEAHVEGPPNRVPSHCLIHHYL